MYQGQHGDLRIWADAPEPVLARDGTWFIAKPFRVTGTLLAEGDEHTFWLDGTGRMVRWDLACIGNQSHCNVAYTHWEFRGALAPRGIGWEPLLAVGGPIAANVNDPSLQLSVQVLGPDRYQVAGEGLPRMGLVDFDGRYVYDGSPFPKTIERLGPSGWAIWVERQSVQWGKEHGAVDRAPLEAWSLPPQSASEIKGGDKPVNPWTVASSRFVQALRDDPSAGPTLNSGCILSAFAELPGDPIDAAILPPSEIMALIVQPEFGVGKQWYVTHDRRLGSDRFTVEAGDDSVMRDCHLARRGIVTWPDAFALLELLLPRGATILGYGYLLSTPETKQDVLHTPGIYRFLYRSSDGDGPRVPYRIEISATDGMPVRLYTAPDERDEIFAAIAAP